MSERQNLLSNQSEHCNSTEDHEHQVQLLDIIFPLVDSVTVTHSRHCSRYEVQRVNIGGLHIYHMISSVSEIFDMRLDLVLPILMCVVVVTIRMYVDPDASRNVDR